MRELSPRQLAFAAAYAKHGVAERAAVEAGYGKRTARAQGSRLLTNADIVAELGRLVRSTESATIADAVERKTFLTTTLRDAEGDMKDRLKACELLGKMEGDFLERRELTGKDGAPLQPAVIEYVRREP